MPLQGLNPDWYQRGAVAIKDLLVLKPCLIFGGGRMFFSLQGERGRYSRVQTQDLWLGSWGSPCTCSTYPWPGLWRSVFGQGTGLWRSVPGQGAGIWRPVPGQGIGLWRFGAGKGAGLRQPPLPWVPRFQPAGRRSDLVTAFTGWVVRTTGGGGGRFVWTLEKGAKEEGRGMNIPVLCGSALVSNADPDPEF